MIQITSGGKKVVFNAICFKSLEIDKVFFFSRGVNLFKFETIVAAKSLYPNKLHLEIDGIFLWKEDVNSQQSRFDHKFLKIHNRTTRLKSWRKRRKFLSREVMREFSFSLIILIALPPRHITTCAS